MKEEETPVCSRCKKHLDENAKFYYVLPKTISDYVCKKCYFELGSAKIKEGAKGEA